MPATKRALPKGRSRSPKAKRSFTKEHGLTPGTRDTGAPRSKTDPKPRKRRMPRIK